MAKSLEPAGVPRWRALGRLSWLATAFGALLVPKCPLCVMGLLSFLGMDALAASSAAPFIRPLAVGLSVVFLLLVIRSERRAIARRRARSRELSLRSCCG